MTEANDRKHPHRGEVSAAGLVRFGALAAVVGGTLRIVASFLPGDATHLDELLYAVVDIGLFLGLITIALSRAGAVGRTGLVLFTVATIGIASLIGPEPDLANDGLGIDSYEAASALVAAALAGASITLLRARTLPVSAALWLAAPLPALVPDDIGLATAGLLFGAGFVTAGWRLLDDLAGGWVPGPERPVASTSQDAQLSSGRRSTLYARRGALAPLPGHPVRL